MAGKLYFSYSLLNVNGYGLHLQIAMPFAQQVANNLLYNLFDMLCSLLISEINLYVFVVVNLQNHF